MIMQDIVIPEGNEKALIAMAERLGYSGLVFLVKDRNLLREEQGRIDDLGKGTELNLSVGLFMSGKENRSGKAMTVLKDPENPRGAIEQRMADWIMGLEYEDREDKLHHRRSGLNQVLAKIMAEKEVGLCYSFKDFLSVGPGALPVLLGRVALNIRIAKKYGVRVCVGSFASDPLEMRNPEDLKALFRLQGMPTQMLSRLGSL